MCFGRMARMVDGAWCIVVGGGLVVGALEMEAWS